MERKKVDSININLENNSRNGEVLEFFNECNISTNDNYKINQNLKKRVVIKKDNRYIIYYDFK